jgi:hypothetical protein
MVTLKRGADGAYRARKRIPDALRTDYVKLYGRSFEEKFFAPATRSQHVAKQLFGDWLAKVEGQLTALRAQRAGEGITLAPRQAAGLAGEWYDWFLARHPLSDEEQWEEWRDKIQSALKDAAGGQEATHWKEHFDGRFIQAGDGPFFLHILRDPSRRVKALAQQNPKASAKDDAPLILLSQMRTALQQRFDEASDNPERFQKIDWFVQYWNAQIDHGIAGLEAISLRPL